MEKVIQIVITFQEEPVDTPRGEVYKVVSFGNGGVLDHWYFSDIESALVCVKGEMEDLVAP